MHEDVQLGKTGLVTEALLRRYDPCRPRDCPYRTPVVPTRPNFFIYLYDENFG